MRLFSVLSAIGLTAAVASAGFVKVGEDGNFEENGDRYVVWGANYWEAMNLGKINLNKFKNIKIYIMKYLYF